MKIVFALLLLPSLAMAARDPKKCGHVLVNRAIEQHRLGFRVARLPNDCTNVELPSGFDGRPGVAGSEIWSEGVRLVWAIDTREAPIRDLSPLPEEMAKKYILIKYPRKTKRTVTTQHWVKDKLVITTEEFEL